MSTIVGTDRIAPLLEGKAEPVPNAGQLGPIVLSTRIRLARNLAAFPFPGWAKESQRRDIMAAAFDALSHQTALKKGLQLKTENLSDLEKLILVERHLISRELQGSKHAAGVFVGKDAGCSVMINEEDHLRIQMMRGGLRLKQLWKSISELDTALESELDYAYQTDWGYLTACPTNLGTGLRASAMLHLPGLVLSGNMEKVIRMVNQVGVAVRGLFGEGTDATGSIFQISNQQTLGETEEDIIKRIGSIISAVIQQEQFARMKLIEDNAAKLFDKVGRAYGILQNAHLLTSEEAMNLLSLLRLAVDIEMLPEEHRPTMDRLFIEVQPGHVQAVAGGQTEPVARDAMRAQMLREEFRAFPALNFAISTDENSSSDSSLN